MDREEAERLAHRTSQPQGQHQLLMRQLERTTASAGRFPRRGAQDVRHGGRPHRHAHASWPATSSLRPPSAPRWATTPPTSSPCRSIICCATASARHRGLVLKPTGDGLMAVFEAATDALGAAESMHQATERHNRDAPDLERLILRIGVSAGDVQFIAHDCHGTPDRRGRPPRRRGRAGLDPGQHARPLAGREPGQPSLRARRPARAQGPPGAGPGVPRAVGPRAG